MAGEELLGNSRYRRTLLLIILVVAVTSFTAIYIPMRITTRVDERIKGYLQSALYTTHHALQIWADRSEDEALVLAGRPGLATSVQAQLDSYRKNGRLESPALKDIQNLMANATQIYQWLGFAVIAPNGAQIAAETGDLLGKTTIVEHNPSLWRTVVSGKVYFGLPFESDLPSSGKEFRQPVMIIGAPVRNSANQVIAALTLWVDPSADFAETVQLGRLQNTGETYAFDNLGRLLTPSRFAEDIERGGGAAIDGSPLSTEIRDPGGDTTTGFKPSLPRSLQPLTRMAQSAIHEGSGVDVDGYRDYRGVPVVGAWLWDTRLNIGLATEMNTEEAFYTSRAVKRLTVFMLLVVLGGAAALVFMMTRRARLQAVALNYEQAVHAREDLMAMVSHDLKNPINSLALRTSILMNKLEELPARPQFLREQLESMRAAVTRMDKLVGDLTDLTRIESGRLRIEKQETTIELIVRPVLETLGPLISQKELQFDVQIPGDLPPLVADAGRIGQVLSNLLGNAIKFTPENGAISLDIRLLQKEVQFAVSDSGPGISSTALPHVFEQYWQVNRSKSGMGLGLFIAKSLVEAHDGRIWIESPLRQGTIIRFTLPC
jgi:signal transduction histidine kinase